MVLRESFYTTTSGISIIQFRDNLLHTFGRFYCTISVLTGCAKEIVGIRAPMADPEKHAFVFHPNTSIKEDSSRPVNPVRARSERCSTLSARSWPTAAMIGPSSRIPARYRLKMLLAGDDRHPRTRGDRLNGSTPSLDAAPSKASSGTCAVRVPRTSGAASAAWSVLSRRA